MFPFRIGSAIIGLILLNHSAPAQQVIPVSEILSLALDSSYQVRAAARQIDYEKLLEKKAGHIPDPELILESTTGDFMTFGVQQSFDFPTVYTRQKQLARQQTILAEKSKNITEADYAWKIKSIYLEWQYAITEMNLLNIQDSLYAAIDQTAEKQFLAGQIDFVDKSYAGIKYAEVHAQWLAAQMEIQTRLQQMQGYTGISDSINPTDLEKAEVGFLFSSTSVDQEMLSNTPIMAYHQQRSMIVEKAVQLEKSKVWPDFTIGYLNPAGRETPFPLRLRFGLSVPLWFWQHSASIKAAEENVNVIRLNSNAGQQDLTQQWNKAKNDALKQQVAMNYFETDGLEQADEMARAAERMFAAGQYDYVKYLTTLSDAFQIRKQYLELLKNYNQAIITLEYLMGQK